MNVNIGQIQICIRKTVKKNVVWKIAQKKTQGIVYE